MMNIIPIPFRWTTSVYFLLALIVGFLSITSQSLWMDEGSTVFKALFPTLKDWWAITFRIGGSDVQMPVYMFLVWCWEKIGASSEYALRCINLPWLVIATLALQRVRFWPLLILTSPFMLYYTGELRPYAMQVAAGSVAALALIKIRGNHDSSSFAGLHTAGVAAVFLSASSLTSAVWAAGLGLGILIMKPAWLKKTGFWMRLSPWLMTLALLGAYYLMTLVKGYRAAAGDGGGIMSILFGFYELLGLTGLGPSRNEIRSDPSSILNNLPILVPATLIIAVSWFHGAWVWRTNSNTRTVTAVALTVLVPLAIFTFLGMLADFRVLGRHLSPMLPAILIPIALSLESHAASKRVWKFVGAIAVCFFISSALALRFLGRHERDDYRQASSIAIKSLQQGKRVWWQADMNATRFYAYRIGGMPMVNAIQVMESDIPPSLLSADIVVINRADLRYRGKDYQSDLMRNYFEKTNSFTGFEIWETR